MTETWEKFSGTGEQAQLEALKVNLREIKSKLEFIVSDYQTSGIASKEPVNEFLASVKEMTEKIEAINKMEL
jgi:hypothetical protein